MPPVTLTTANQTISVKVGDLIISALLMMGAAAPGEAISADDSNWGLENLQRRIDLINAQKPLIYNINFVLFNFLANHSPITIGPAGDFNVANPPVEIASAALVLTTGGSSYDLPIQVLKQSEWAGIALKSLTSTLPTAIFYSREFPLGNIYPWPIPKQANQMRLELWSNFSQAIDLNTNLAMPPAYWSFLLCTLALDMAPPFGAEAITRVQSPAFLQQYREARNAIQSNNGEVPPLASDVPSGRHGSAIPDFNYLTRQRD